MKKALIIIASLVVVALIGRGVYYFIADKNGNFQFEVLSAKDATAKLVKFESHRADNVVIPETAEIDGKKYKVAQIGTYAFRDCESVEKITIPATVTEICAGAFLNCPHLAEVVLPETIVRIGSNEAVTIHEKADEQMAQSIIDAASALSKILPEEETDTATAEAAPETEAVAEIEESSVEMPGSEYFAEGAFEGCTALTKINLPNSVKYIGHNTFRDCIKLASISLPNSIRQLGMGTFRGCRALTVVDLPDSLKVVDSQVFAQCYNLKRVDIPEGVEIIGEMAFEDCESLSQINIPASVTRICALAFDDCRLINSLALPEGLTVIELGAFNGMGISQLTIPASVENIAGNIVRGCVNLASITVAPGNTHFKASDGNLYNDVTDELIFHVAAAEQKALVVPEGIVAVASFAFDGCKRLESVVLPASIKEIGEQIFYGCDDTLKNLELKAMTPPAIVGPLFGLEQLDVRNHATVQEPIVPSKFSLIVPDKVKKAYEESEDWEPYLVDHYSDDVAVEEEDAIAEQTTES
ncbi:MAG: leucine-rich repeat domain-containing protein [Muribaculaceae bacterium]|nr:leucine-rich repeat domain-containing protein [Muribaculaceae bacterium]